MKGHQRVVVHLQRVLSVQLGALDQLLLHARMCEDWGFTKLADQGQSAVERAQGHVDQLMRRMLFLGGTPDLSQRDPVKVGDSARELMRLDLESQYQLAETLRSAIACCADEHDFETYRVLGELLTTTEEDHTYWLEQQLGLIQVIGLEIYLAAQL